METIIEKEGSNMIIDPYPGFLFPLKLIVSVIAARKMKQTAEKKQQKAQPSKQQKQTKS